MQSVFTCDPNVELDGHSSKALLRSMLSDDYIDLLQEYGLDEIDEESWYPLQNLLKVLGELAQRGSMMELVSIGMAAADASIIPPEVEAMDAPDFLLLYNKIYPTRWRNGDPGHMTVEIVDPSHLIIDDYTPFPDDLFYGLMYGFVRRFNRSGRTFSVRYDDSIQGKKHGGEFTRLHVVWN